MSFPLYYSINSIDNDLLFQIIAASLLVLVAVCDAQPWGEYSNYKGYASKVDDDDLFGDDDSEEYVLVRGGGAYSGSSSYGGGKRSGGGYGGGASYSNGRKKRNANNFPLLDNEFRYNSGFRGDSSYD